MNWLTKIASIQFMYHGTNIANLSTVLSQGLNTNHPKVWNQERGQRDNYHSLESYGGIYFSNNFMTAYGSASRAAHKKEDNYRAAVLVVAQLELRTPSIWLDEDQMKKPHQAMAKTFNMILEEGSNAFMWWINEGYPDLDKIIELFLQELGIQNQYIIPHAEAYTKAYAKMQAALGIERSKKQESYRYEKYEEMYPDLDVGYQQANSEFIAVANNFAQKIHSLTNKDSEGYNHNIRVQEPVNFRGTNKIVLIASFHDVDDEKYYKEVIIHYNQSPQAIEMMINDAKKSLSHSLLIKDNQGNIYYDQPIEQKVAI